MSNADDTLGEMFLEEKEPNEDDIMVRTEGVNKYNITALLLEVQYCALYNIATIY